MYYGSSGWGCFPETSKLIGAEGTHLWEAKII